MAKDNLERRAYRRSPGRQYEPEYDPLREQSVNSTTGSFDASSASGRWSGRGENTSQSGQNSHRSSTLLAQRPDPRRTRQLMRQSILASKTHISSPGEEQSYDDDVHDERTGRNVRRRNGAGENEQRGFDGYADSTVFEPQRFGSSSNRLVRQPQRYIVPEEEQWNDVDERGFVDPDRGYDYDEPDPLDQRALHPAVRRAQNDFPVAPRRNDPVAYDETEEEYDEGYEDEEVERDEKRPARQQKKKGVSRRKLLVGLGVVAAGGVAAYELVPRIPQALNDVGTNIEHQLQDAYNRGIAAGGEAVRKELVNSLDTLEGVSLEGAIGAAKLTRVAYDVFVSPLVTLAATVAGDFLNITLRALITGRSWLAAIKQDNDTLAALQTVLETWIKQVNAMPKQIQSITDADLDGAQSYLHALQLKIQQEQAKINAAQSTATPTTSATAKPTTKPTP
ncbi:MAG TPA: hypothetical protein VKR42_13285 [Ktedonobacteraceae bacterium]|nr:hypothetical protein [Ktedonobacteraceae bacterium]